MSVPDLAPILEHPGLVDDYSPVPGCYDEMRPAKGEVRPHWQYFLDALRTLGPTGIEERWREATRMVRDNGVTYNLNGDDRGISRPWELDLLPLLIRSEEWSALERGLMQRAELFNLILLDLYGPRDLINRGLLPADLIDGYSDYLLPCWGIEVAGRRPLVHYAADLTRMPDGRWRVIGDRTQSPLGAGYALENRVVLSRVLPSLFRDSHVHRLAGFFRSMRRTLTGLAGRDGHGRVVVLTPGPQNEAYFEHAYLANYLGYTLVQGGDLSVRDGALWLRTLGRLERIDGVLRRVDDDWCDPLELGEDSLIGVPGLVAAVRAGNVMVANALGSGVLEHPGLMAFLPALCQQLLGEDLLLPDIDTWWCGNPKALELVLANLDGLVIKQAGKPPGERCLFPAAMEPSARDALIAAIAANPRSFVAQEYVKPSTAPALIGQHMEPRPGVLRTFLVAEDDGYAVMPGGLARVALSADAALVTSQLGGLGKDAWVLASEPERQESLLVAGETQSPAITQESEVSSRVADNLFWMGRYAERAEGLVRLLRICIFRLSERAELDVADSESCYMRSLLEALTNQSQTFPGFVGDGAAERLRNPVPEMLSLISDPERRGGLPYTLQSLGQAAYSVRDRLSIDTWRIVSDIEGRLTNLTSHPPDQLSLALDELDPLVTSLVAFSGLIQENMTHNEGWHFLEAGRRLERGTSIAALLRSTLAPLTGDQDEITLIEAVLGITDSLITYRRRYRAGTRIGALLELVFQDESNPRALAYQLVQLERLMAQMPKGDLAVGRTAAEKLLMKSLTEIRLAELDALAQADPKARCRLALDETLRDLDLQLAAVSDAITAQYFRHEEQPHSLLRRVGAAAP